MTRPVRDREGGRVVLLLLLGLVVLFGGGYAAAYAGAGDRVPRGTTVAGVEIGGMTSDEAVRELERGLGDREDRLIELTVAGDVHRVRPSAAGLAVDYRASVAAAGDEQSWDPQRLWDHYTGGDDLPAVLDVDESRMSTFLDDLATDVGRPARNGRVRFDGSRIVTTDPRSGEQVDPDSVREQLEQAYLSEDDREPAEVALNRVAPEIDETDVRRAVERFANPAVSAPVVLRFGAKRITLNPRDYTAALRLRPQDGKLVPTVDHRALMRLLDTRINSHGRPVDARFRIRDGKPRIVPSRPGVRYRARDVRSAFLDLVTRPSGKRDLRVKAVAERADFTTADARKLRIRERVSTFATAYPHAEYRNVNIGRAAELVDGTVLEPGETFSLNGIVGERTRANGFTEGYVISDGILVTDLGGGVSQLATTLFNAMFFAGLEDVEHKPHSFYIDRYPVGREATVAWGSVDLRFKNTTPYGVLVTADVTPSTPTSSGEVRVSMWSTKRWDITTRTGDRYHVTEPETRKVDTRRCHPNEGYGGFDINVWRYFHRPGSDKVVRSEKFHTSYTPSDTVVCTNPNAVDG